MIQAAGEALTQSRETNLSIIVQFISKTAFGCCIVVGGCAQTLAMLKHGVPSRRVDK